MSKNTQFFKSPLNKQQIIELIEAFGVSGGSGSSYLLISVASDFPTSAEATAGAGSVLYIAAENVTDNDPTKTDTGQSFLEGDIFVWDEADTKYIKTQVVGGSWGAITGTLSSQTDLQSALNAKEDVANKENTTIDTSITKYPTVNLLKTGLDTKEPTITNLPFTKGGTGINDLTGQANKFIRVKSDGTGYELVVEPVVEQPSKVLFVDKNRTDSYTADGTIDRPFKTIQATIDHIATLPDKNSSPYNIDIFSGTYAENVNINNKGIFSLTLTTLGRVAINPASGNSLTANTDVSDLQDFKAWNIEFGKPVVLKGTSTANNFKTTEFYNSYFSDTFSAETLNNLAFINSRSDSTVSLTNVNYTVSISGYIAGNLSLTFNSAVTAPASGLVGGMNVFGTVLNLPVLSTSGLVTMQLALYSVKIGSSSVAAVTIPTNCFVSAYNSTLRGVWTNNSSLILRNSMTENAVLGNAPNVAMLQENVQRMLNALTAKFDIVDADKIPLLDSEASNVAKTTTVASLKATVKTNSFAGSRVKGFFDLSAGDPPTPTAGDAWIASTSGGLFTGGNIYIYNGTNFSDLVVEKKLNMIVVNEDTPASKTLLYNGLDWVEKSLTQANFDVPDMVLTGDIIAPFRIEVQTPEPFYLTHKNGVAIDGEYIGAQGLYLKTLDLRMDINTGLTVFQIANAAGSPPDGINIEQFPATAVAFTNMINCRSSFIGTNNTIIALDVSSLEVVQGDVAFAAASLTELDFSALRIGLGRFNPDCAALETVDLTALEYQFGDIEINAANFTDFIWTEDVVKYVGGDFLTTNNTLNEASVDSIVKRLADLDGTNDTRIYENKTVTITGGASAPSITGNAAVLTLIGRGCTVTTN
jgi:hypothetical protein